MNNNKTHEMIIDFRPTFAIAQTVCFGFDSCQKCATKLTIQCFNVLCGFDSKLLNN